MTKLENLIIFHCAPTLLGIKQANLFSCPTENPNLFKNEVKYYNNLFNSKDVYLKILYSFENKFFVIVYRKKQMLETLQKPNVDYFLKTKGYPNNKHSMLYLHDMLTYLGKRIIDCDTFPHEIGFFLGYPPADVMEFIRQEGKNYKFCGYWKVYGDEEQALKKFAQYKKCQEVLLRKATTGVSIFNMLG